MSIYQKKTIVDSVPAYDVVALAPNADGSINLKADDQLCAAYISRNHGKLYRTYTIGSVVSYALQRGENPIEEYADAVSRGHKTHWINGNSVCLTSHKQERKAYILVEPGETVVKFEGILFKVVSAPNDNLDLVRI